MGASGPSNEESKGDLDCIVAPPPGWKADCTGQMNASNRPPRRLPVGGSSTCDKGPDFLVPTTKTPAARPHKVARNVMTPQTSIKSIAIVTDDAPQFILRRRRTLPSTEHMIGHRVRSNVADEVAERTARSHNDRYQFRAPSSFSNSSPLPDFGKCSDDSNPTALETNRRHANTPRGSLVYSRVESCAPLPPPPISPFRPEANIITSATIVKEKEFRSCIRTYKPNDHLETSGYRPRSIDFEKVEQPVPRGVSTPANAWSFNFHLKNNPSESAVIDFPTSPRRSFAATPPSPPSPRPSSILSFKGAHIFQDDYTLSHDTTEKEMSNIDIISHISRNNRSSANRNNTNNSSITAPGGPSDTVNGPTRKNRLVRNNGADKGNSKSATSTYGVKTISTDQDSGSPMAISISRKQLQLASPGVCTAFTWD